MSEDEIKIISKEDYQNEELSDQKIIFVIPFWTNKRKRIRLKCWKSTWNTYFEKLV